MVRVKDDTFLLKFMGQGSAYILHPLSPPPPALLLERIFGECIYNAYLDV